MLQWSGEQQRCFDERRRSLLVSAAAGSGKTATLAERCARLICDGNDACDANNLLVVTFTEEAAAEMKSRIEKALRDRLLQTPDDVRVRQQIALLPGAQISTIHAFCARVLRQHFQSLRLDPDFAVLDEQEALLLCREVAGELLEESFARKSKTFADLVDLYADGNDGRIEEQIIQTHNVLCSLVDPVQWRREATQRLREVEQKPQLFDTRLGYDYLDMVMRKIQDLQLHAQAILPKLRANPEAAGCDWVAEQIHSQLGLLLKQCTQNWDQARDLLPTLAPKLPAGTKSDGRERGIALLDTLRGPLKASGEISRLLASSEDEMRQDIIRTITPAECFLDLVGEFSDRYRQAKRQENLLDFSDLEHLGLEVLSDEAIAAQYREHFRYIMVDEFQDVNALQWELMRRVARCDSAGELTNLFCVGDVKQSIYRFRLADPSIFRAQDDHWRGRDQVVDMRQNFRSRKPLLDTINLIFRDLMRREVAEIEYDRTQELKGERDFPADPSAFTGQTIEAHLLIEDEQASEESAGADQNEEDLTRVQKEAAYTAALIGDLVTSQKHVTPRDGEPRPVRFGDIVVLLRSAKFTVVEYTRALSEAGIPVHAESRTGFFQATEINEMLSVLRLLDNEQQDIPLAAVLRSPVMGVPRPEEALARIRLAYRELPFHAAVAAYAAQKQDELSAQLGALLKTLHGWRDLSSRMGVADLLWKILADTAYTEFAAGLSGGKQRVANLMFLHRCARKFSTFRRQGLYRFLEYIQQLEERSDLGQPSPGEPGNAVRVMTVHAAKGLESPVVIVSGLGAKWNLADRSGSILIHRRHGIAVAVADDANEVRYPTAASLIIKDVIKNESLAEELRVLYVAMTRAQEHLVLLGTCTAKQREQWLGGPTAGQDPALFHAAGCYLQWLVPLIPLSHGHLVEAKLSPAAEAFPIPAAVEMPVAAATPSIWDVAYPFAALTEHAATTSVTGLSKGDEVPTVVADDDYDNPPRVTADAQVAKARGIVMHLFMEHFDFGASAAPAKAQLAALVRSGVITDKQASLVNVDEVAWLTTQSSLAELLKANSAAIYRELPLLDSVAPDGWHADAHGLDRRLLRGRIDAVIPTDEGIVVVDYKTDRTLPKPGSERERAYRKQVSLYRHTIERSGMGNVAAVYLVFLACRDVRAC